MYNYNPRENHYREVRIKELFQRQDQRRAAVPVGKQVDDQRMNGLCGQENVAYHDCLKATEFDLRACKPIVEQLRDCQQRPQVINQGKERLKNIISEREKQKRKVKAEMKVQMKTETMNK